MWSWKAPRTRRWVLQPPTRCVTPDTPGRIGFVFFRVEKLDGIILTAFAINCYRPTRPREDWLCFARLTLGNADLPMGMTITNWLCLYKTRGAHPTGPARNWLCFARAPSDWNVGMMESWNGGGVLSPENWVCFAQSPAWMTAGLLQIGFVSHFKLHTSPNWLCSAQSSRSGEGRVLGVRSLPTGPSANWLWLPSAAITELSPLTIS